MTLPIHKVIISGTGRAGTTFLVRLLTELGLDTGFTRRSWRRDYFEHCQAGLERNILSPQAPYIVKSPNLCDALPSALATGNFVIDRAIIPIRDLEEAALSRVRIGGASESVPGGLWKTDDPAAQKAVLGEAFHRLVLTLAENDIPMVLIVFPRMVQDTDYAYNKLRFLLGRISRSRFQTAFARVANPALVHHFPAASPAPAPAQMLPREEFVAARRRYFLRRKVRHIAVRLGIAAALALLAFGAWRIRSAPVRFALNRNAPALLLGVGPKKPEVNPRS